MAGGRADLYFDGQWISISWDNIEKLSYSGSDNVRKKREQNDKRIKSFIEADENIEWASDQLRPIIDKLEEVETYNEDEEE